MHSRIPHENKAIPPEYRKIAEDLFPPGGFPQGQGPTVKAAEAFAEILGIGADYKSMLNTPRSSGEVEHFLGHFQNNLDLLIQKTWVDKADENRKEKLQNRIPDFIAIIGEENYRDALGEFGAILEELAHLFFGAQSRREDFTEYTFRMDAQLGLFWWYGGQIGCLRPVCDGKSCAGCNSPGGIPQEVSDNGSLWAVLLIGICYLTNF
jgi:hypothetical protein